MFAAIHDGLVRATATNLPRTDEGLERFFKNPAVQPPCMLVWTNEQVRIGDVAPLDAEILAVVDRLEGVLVNVVEREL